jgi:hypothetical protein
MQEQIEYIGSFKAVDGKGKSYTIRMYQPNGDAAPEVIATARMLRLIDSTPVERIAKGRYRVVDIPGRDVILTSEDPSAP